MVSVSPERGHLEFRLVGPDDAEALADLFGDIDATYFRPHPFTPEEARRIASRTGQDAYVLLFAGGRPVAYGMLRGWDEGYATPSLGIATRIDSQRRGFGRLMMGHLHDLARRRGAESVRLRVHRNNVIARRLYESLAYEYAGRDRGELVMTLDVSRPELDPRL
jgi:ribosomal protein S18 acetylase RimI-like enzyme